MSDFITLSCPSCGGRLEITKDMDRFVCAHCGNEQIVRRAGGTISLAPVMEGLQKVQASTDRVSAELAIQRLTKELAESDIQLRSAQTKVIAAGSQSASAPLLLLMGLLLLAAALFLVVAMLNLFRDGMAVPANVLCPGSIFLVAGFIGAVLATLWRRAANTANRAATQAKAALRQVKATNKNIRAELERQRALAKGV